MITQNISVALTFKNEPKKFYEYPAIVVWLLPNGVAWMQPGYMDPYGAPSPQFHILRGALSLVNEIGTVAVLENDDLTAWLRVADESSDRSVQQAFEWYEQKLAENGMDRQAEALRLSEELAETLGYRSASPDELDG
jgi:hypothetical protein